MLALLTMTATKMSSTQSRKSRCTSFCGSYKTPSILSNSDPSSGGPSRSWRPLRETPSAQRHHSCSHHVVLSSLMDSGPNSFRVARLIWTTFSQVFTPSHMTFVAPRSWGNMDVWVETALFVFPHRTQKLSKYGRHIRQLFASFPEGLHLRIIYYDCAVCLRASWHATYCSLILPSSVTSTHFGFRMVGPVAVPSLLIPLV